MITLDNVHKVYTTDRLETTALSEVNLDIAAGEFVSVMGPSGCGKSTLLNVMGLLDEPSQGQVRIDDEMVTGQRDHALAELRNAKIGFVFQTFHLVPDLTVIENVEIPLLYRHVARKERRTRCREVLEQVGLGSRIHHFPSQLSGGQQQRVAVARAVVGQPKILLADEPTGNLDSQMGTEIMEILHRTNRELGTTVVMVTHDAQLARETDRTLRLFDGRQVS